MADVDQLLPYVPYAYPSLPGGEALYLVDELQKLQDSISKIIEVLALLEARIEVLEP